MNREQFAEMLNGREYGSEITEAEEKLAKESGLLVCFGYSDDNLELRGIINDEVGAYDGGIALIVNKISKHGKFIDVIANSDMEELMELIDGHQLDLKIPSVAIEAEWGPSEPNCSWIIKTDLPHSTFDTMEDGDLFCRGIVIDKSDIEKAL